jgi:hypothetical protein
MKLDAMKVAWLLPLLLSACAHNTIVTQMQQMAPPIEDTPPPPIAPANLPSPVITIPNTDKPVVVVQEAPAKQPPKHKKPASKSVATSPSTPSGAGGPPGTQVAENAPPSEVNAGGSFTTKPEAADSRKLAEDSIAEIEKGLNGIGHKLSDTEEKTSMQIKEFLKEARTALDSGDVEAANNLTKKAKALLGELSP